MEKCGSLTQGDYEDPALKALYEKAFDKTTARSEKSNLINYLKELMMATYNENINYKSCLERKYFMIPFMTTFIFKIRLS